MEWGFGPHADDLLGKGPVGTRLGRSSRDGEQAEGVFKAGVGEGGLPVHCGISAAGQCGEAVLDINNEQDLWEPVRACRSWQCFQDMEEASIPPGSCLAFLRGILREGQ